MKSVAADEELANLPTDDATVKMAAAMMQAFEFSISDIKIDGDTATATITMKGEMMGQKMDESYPGKFKKVDGKWLIAKMQEK